VLLSLLLTLQGTPLDTLRVRSIDRRPLPQDRVDSLRYGAPQIRLVTRQGTALVWFLRAADTVFVAASIPDSTRYWGDDFVLSFDTRGDAADSPQHDDFQWYFRRAIDSSVVFRGRNGRWEPPKGDPDWRLGTARSGGGWEVSATDGPRGWTVLLRLDPAWFVGESGARPRVAFRIYDDSPSGWFSWPSPPGKTPASSVEETPSLWVSVR
jgi:hypothetical protein